jgi:hypothetical protein
MRSSEWFGWVLLWFLIGLAAVRFLAVREGVSSGVWCAEVFYAR